MKTLLAALLLTLSLSARAEYIDSNLQAVITSPKYAAALAQAAKAVERTGLDLTLGDTSVLRLEGPAYFFYIPVNAVRVPLSPEPPRNVGSIVAKLQVNPNAPVPHVLAIYFKPAPEPAR